MKRDPRFLRPYQGVDRSSARKKRRFRLVVCAAVLLMAAAIGCTYLAYQFIMSPSHFKVNNLTIEGAVFADVQAIRQETLKVMNGNMLLVNLRDVCAVIERIPWIKEAKARKVLPDAMHVTVTERRPIVFVIIDGEIFLADKNGTLLDKLRPEHPFTDLPLIRGIIELPEEERQPLLSMTAALMQELKTNYPEWYQRISELDVSDPERLSIHLIDRETPIIVGDRDIISRLNKYFLIEASLDQRYDSAEYIDVRFDRRLFVKPTGR